MSLFLLRRQPGKLGQGKMGEDKSCQFPVTCNGMSHTLNCNATPSCNLNCVTGRVVTNIWLKKASRKCLARQDGDPQNVLFLWFLSVVVNLYTRTSQSQWYKHNATATLELYFTTNRVSRSDVVASLTKFKQCFRFMMKQCKTIVSV